MVDHAVWPALPEGHVEGIQHEPGAQVVGHGPVDTGIRKEAQVPQRAAGQCIEGATVMFDEVGVTLADSYFPRDTVQELGREIRPGTIRLDRRRWIKYIARKLIPITISEKTVVIVPIA